jgi:hypothetical protein
MLKVFRPSFEVVKVGRIFAWSTEHRALGEEHGAEIQ